MDLTGINNYNEYFTNHYLSSIFEENAKETISAWRDAAKNDAAESDQDDSDSALSEAKEGIKTKTPWSLLRSSARFYFTVRERFVRVLKLDDKDNAFAKTTSDALNDIHVMSLTKELADNCLASLGYPQATPRMVQQSETLAVPVYLEVKKTNGAPNLWALLCSAKDKESGVMDGYAFDGSALESDGPAIPAITSMSNEDLATKILFGMDEPPRWLLLIDLYGIALIDRVKWNEKRYISFDLDEIFRRREESTLQAMAVLLHRESLCPDEGSALLDTLSENSHRHANGVSQNLKYALREAIELLGNEVIYFHTANSSSIDTDQLAMECLRFMYGILFVLFIESRAELEYAPIKAPPYMKGYSFEHLRDITEKVREDVNEIGNGYYLQETLFKQFDLIYNGYPESFAISELDSLREAFVIEPLKAHIFDSEYTKLIRASKLRNTVMLKIIDLMSISRSSGRKQSPSRISYSTLGINQMGAVYEALLSYRGFVAEETLFEVKRKKDDFDELNVGYFVPESKLEDYDEDERVRYDSRDPKSNLRKYEKGTFIYRLAGREREKSASYYTPEVLTKCLVKYALKELLKDKTADDILCLAICEPAMGSAAFLNEAVNQLAEAYLELKQKETGDLISHENRQQELQKVKMFLADRCVYGIDLNPIAVELAEVSLWLNTIYKSAFVPWFRAQLFNGNSLIGARRQVYSVAQLTATRAPDRWWENAPDRVNPGEKAHAAKNQVYHFLTGDPGMADYTDKVIKSLAPDAIKDLKKWNKDFIKPYKPEEVETLKRITGIIDKFWLNQINHLKSVRKLTTDSLSIYGRMEEKEEAPTTIREKDSIFDQLYRTVGGDNASPYARLKFAMDYWCSLWFWPIHEAEQLPSRSEFLFDMDLILEGTVNSISSAQMTMFEQTETEKRADEIRDIYAGYAWTDLGKVDLNDLCQKTERLRIARDIAQQQHFFHWELEFADVFADKGGFDLILGNPPWIKLEWNEQSVLADKNPMFAVKKMTATQTAQKRAEALIDISTNKIYFLEYESISGIKNFINAQQNYRLLKGQQSNLYKCFLPQAWNFENPRGVSGFLHPDGIYDDPGGGLFRKAVYSRLRFHFQFVNEKLLFPEIDDHIKFSVNIYSYAQAISFDSISNLYDPLTIEQCYDNSISSNVPGIKDENNNWNIKGHPSRVIHISNRELQVFSKLLDENNVWSEARLPAIHSRELFEVLRLFASQTYIGSKKIDSFCSEMWHETNSQKDNTISRSVGFPDSINTAIYSGPHINVANPLYKCSRAICSTNSDYDCIDPTNIPEDYMQRCNYKPGIPMNEYQKAAPDTPWSEKYTNEYRIAQRSMVASSSERTLSSAVIPPGACHIDTLFSLCLRHNTGFASGLMASLPYDFFIKATGKSHVRFDIVSRLPLPLDAVTRYEIVARSLLLNCLTKYYSDLWKSEWNDSFRSYTWSKHDPRLRPEKFSALDPTWAWHTPLRTDYERRQALVELDVLSAMALGMTLQQLKTIYRIQFPVLQNYESDTWYDQNGRIVFTINRGLPNIGFPRAEWERIKNASSGTFTRTIEDDTLPGGLIERTIEYVAPFDRCDRVQDFETAWKFFAAKYGEPKASKKRTAKNELTKQPDNISETQE
jgi:type I restriction-modification system DNA methylase subunit